MSIAKTILIVDDSESDRLLCRHYLESDPDHSYRILEAGTISQGLELWRSQNPDITLLDLSLTDGNGLILLEAIREHIQENSCDRGLDLKLPVIILTGNEDARSVVAAMRLGAYDYLIKNDITKFSLQQGLNTVFEHFDLIRKLEQSRQREELISQTALKIRQFINLEDICQAVVQEISQFLQTDRTVIYKFYEDMSRRIIAEAVVSPWQSCSYSLSDERCLYPSESQVNAYLDGQILVNSDIYQSNLSECHVQMLESFQVRANVVVPILLAEQLSNNLDSNHHQNNHTLWGLLIVHQCSAPRNWEEYEIKLLQQLSVQIGIAIQQAEIYQNLQNLNTSLVEQVQERTSELQDSGHKLRSILNAIPDIINLISIDGVYLETKLQRASYDLVPKHIDLLGKKIGDLLAPDIAENQIQAIQNAISSGEMQTMEQTYLVNDDLHYEEVRVAPVSADAAVVVVRDISDRYRAEKSLRASDEKFQKIALSSPVIIEIFVQRADGSTCFEYLSSAFEEIYELPVTQVLQSPHLCFERIHPDDIANFWEAIGISLETLSTLRHEWRIITSSGKTKWLRSNLRPERRKNGDTAWYGIVADISDRKQLEIALEKELIRNRMLLNDSFDGIAILDSVGNVIEGNISFAKMIGYTPEELASLTIYDIDVRWSREELTAGIEEFKLGKSVMFESLYRRKDGSFCNVEVSANSIKWDDDASQLCIFRDITQRKETAIALQHKVQQEQMLNQFIQIIRSSLDLKVVFASATNAIAELLKLEQATIVKYIPDLKIWKHIAAFRDSSEILDSLGLEFPDQDNPFAERLKRMEVVQVNDSSLIEDEINRELAKTITGGWLLVPIIVNNEVWGSLSLRKIHRTADWETNDIELTQTIANQIAIAIQQVTTYQKLEQELAEHKQTAIALAQAKELAEVANKAKSEFLANMSHEIRTPMNGVLGMAQLLAATPLRDDQNNFVQIILDSGEALLTIINDILDFSKIESGNLQLEQKEFVIESILNSICNLLRKQALDKNINLQFYFNNTNPNTVLGDSSRLRQILTNLIGNAIKFTKEGHISIRYSRKLITSNTYEFKFAIADIGMGIDREYITKLFKPFTQADASINRQFGGTGLGLAISKRLVELMGGTIWVESRGYVGGKPPLDWVIDSSNDHTQGSTFYFTIVLPVVDAPTQPTKSVNNLGYSLPNKINFEKFPIKILIVEDNIFNQKIAFLMLQKLGYHAEVVNNGSECLNVIFDQESNLAFDLIFMDVQMPVMDGLIATQMIRKSSASQTYPWIIAFTADVLPEDRQACFDSGMNDYISKPIHIKEIERLLSAYIKENTL